MEIILIL